MMKQFQDLWQPLGSNQKISLILASGLVLLSMIGLMIWAAQPNYQLLYGGLSPDDAGKIIEKLEKQGIDFQTGRGGNSILVRSERVHRLRMELATDGIPSGGTGPGFELFDSGSFGISDFVQRTNYKRAIQGELSRTITQFDGVESARVMVVMPENRIVVSRQNSAVASASVFVDTTGGVTVATVNSIRRLVANAIQGLDINDVAVVDSMGVDWTEELRSDGINGLSNETIRFRTKWESYFTNKVQTMLDSVLGPNQSEVRVAVDIDTSSLQTTEETFDPESQVALNVTTTETSNTETDSTGAGGGGVAGSTSNPAGSGNSAATVRQSEDRNEEKTSNFAVNKTVNNRVQNPGGIKRVTASLFVAERFTFEGEERVNNPRTTEELGEIRQIVMNALGIVLKKGENAADLVTVHEMDFAPNPIASHFAPGSEKFDLGYWVDSVKGIAGLVLGFGVIVFFLQMLKRTKPEQISVEVLQPEQMLQSRRIEDTSSVTPEMLNELIRQKPANIGITLKEWIGDQAGAK